MGMGYGVMISAQQLGQLQEEQSAAGRDGWAFVYRLSRELREAVPPSQLGAGAQWRGTSRSLKLLDMIFTTGWPAVSIQEFNARRLTVSRDTIRFCTLRVASPNQMPVPGVVEYSLLTPRRGKTATVGILRRSAPLGVSLDGKDDKDVVTEVIRPMDPSSSYGYVSLGFQYMDSQGQWRKDWTDTKAMPRAVRISVGTLVRPSRRLTVPVVNEYSTLVYLPTDSRIPQ
jgi:hypothetical protein